MENLNINNEQQYTSQKNVYGYIRVSTETQADKGYGLETQQEAIIKYCNANNLNLINTYIDSGKSGAIGDKDDLSSRPAIVDLLNILNGTNTIIVMNTSRLWRDEAAKVLICKNVRKCGGDIISIEQPRYSLYSKDPQEFLFNSMMEILDQYERMLINLRLSKGKNTKAKNGLKPSGRTPFGYKWTSDGIEIDQEEAVTIKEIFALAQNNNGFRAIADRLNKKNITTRSNNQWTAQSIRAIINNKFYTGILSHQEKEIEGKHEKLIDLETWEYIQSNRNQTKE